MRPRDSALPPPVYTSNVDIAEFGDHMRSAVLGAHELQLYLPKAIRNGGLFYRCYSEQRAHLISVGIAKALSNYGPLCHDLSYSSSRPKLSIWCLLTRGLYLL